MTDINQFRENLDYLLAKGLIQSIPSTKSELEGLMQVAEKTSIPLEHLLLKDLAKREAIRSRDIRMLVMDCDGVLTDGAMIFSKNGDEIKRFNAKDGQGIKAFRQQGKLTGIISAGVSTGLVEKRAEMLGVEHVYVGKHPKIEILQEWMKKLGLTFENIAYIGDDITDIPILKKAGASFCPADAISAVKQTAEVVLSLKGGEGCVRELIEDYLL
jgi:YrbI family 3-deoxy-D-manno-octulosonate 8-phosphate phosphatase